MKQLEFTTEKGRFLIVDLPDHVNAVFNMGYMILTVHNTSNWCSDKTIENPFALSKYLEKHKPEKDYKKIAIKIPEEFNQLVGKVKELTEDIAKSIVESDNNIDDEQTETWLDYNEKNDNIYPFVFVEAISSFYSLLDSLGVCLENPLGKEPETRCSAYTDMFTIAKNARKWEEWQEEQEKVFVNPVIFKVV